jgi:RNA polymerase sigma factor (TIGR02999 family)
MREASRKAVTFFIWWELFSPWLRYNRHKQDMRGVMSIDSSSEITDLLLAWNEGEASALEQLVPLVESELRRLARIYMRRERAGHTLQTTALINEAYVRLIDARRVRWQNRAHFYGLAARLMRRILVDFSRERNYQKRGGGAQQVTFDEASFVSPPDDPDLLALDEALSELTLVDERKAQVVEMRFFGGLTEKEAAIALSVSPETARRDWRLAKAWLLRRLSG